MVTSVLLAAAVLSTVQLPSVTSADLVEAPDISSPTVSPDGRWVAFRVEQPALADNRIHMSWYVQPIDGSTPARRVADGGEAEIDSGVTISQMPIWAPSSSAFYFRALIDGEIQVWRASVNGGNIDRVTTDPANIRSLQLADDGRSLHYDVGLSRDAVDRAEADAADRGVLIDGTVDVSNALSRGGWVAGKPATLRFAKGWFTREPLLWENELRTVTLALRPIDMAAASQEPRTKPLKVRIEDKGDVQTIVATGPDGKDIECSQPICPRSHVRSVVGLRDGKDIVVTTSDAALSQTLSLWAPEAGRWRVIARSKGMLAGHNALSDIPCGVGEAELVCIAADASSPPRLVSIDIATGRVRSLFDPAVSLRARAWPAKELRWQTAAGIEATGQLLMPRDAKPNAGFPLVIDYYSCGGFLKGGVGDELPMAPLAEAGIAVLCANTVRGPSKSEAAEEANAIDAVSRIVDRLSAEGLIDRTRVGMAGLSFGSQVTMAVLAQTKLLRAAAIASLQVEPYYYWANNLPGRDVRPTLQDFFGLGSPDTDPDHWKQVSPALHADRIKAPLLMQLPESEVRQTMELFSRLASSSTPVEMFGFPNETHLKWEPRHKLSVYERNLDWFRFWLLGREDPDPEKADQYLRWQSFASRPGFAVPTLDHGAP
jgi:dipeptidyl aminopeptidase/acylaminoacyl peptidase